MILSSLKTKNDLCFFFSMSRVNLCLWVFFSILFSLNQVQRTWAGGLVHKWAAVGLGMDVVVKKHHME
jgi:hypothetical protein